MLKDFTATMHSDTFKVKISALKDKVEQFAEKFAMPGLDTY